MLDVHLIQDKLNRARHELERVIVGQEEILEALFVALLSRGHVLMVGVPGLAKTLIIHSLAKVIAASFNRVQFTPDLMPSDITGVEVLQEGSREFKFVKGPIFCNILLADEINRTPPKTQSALLQAMQEFKISQGGKTYPLEPPFFVLATQNPIEQEGTYPLPEAQLDRFTFSLFMKYPDFEQEVKIATMEQAFTRNLEVCLSLTELLEAQKISQTVPIGDELVRFAVRINFATRKDSAFATPLVKKYLQWGSGPRASQFLVSAARSRAFLHKRFHVTSEDIEAVAPLVLQHRLVMNFQGEAEGVTVQGILDEAIKACR